MVESIQLLKLLLQEKKYPHFSDDELNLMLNDNNGDVYATASELSLMKADGDKKIKVGPIEIEGPGADYWINLSREYASKATSTSNSNIIGDKTSMSRSDEIDR